MVAGPGEASFQHQFMPQSHFCSLKEFPAFFLFTSPPPRYPTPTPRQTVIPQCVPYVSVLTKGHSDLVSAASIEITLSHFEAVPGEIRDNCLSTPDRQPMTQVTIPPKSSLVNW